MRARELTESAPDRALQSRRPARSRRASPPAVGRTRCWPPARSGCARWWKGRSARSQPRVRRPRRARRPPGESRRRGPCGSSLRPRLRRRQGAKLLNFRSIALTRRSAVSTQQLAEGWAALQKLDDPQAREPRGNGRKKPAISRCAPPSCCRTAWSCRSRPTKTRWRRRRGVTFRECAVLTGALC